MPLRGFARMADRRDREASTPLATDLAHSVEPADRTAHARVKGDSGFEVLVASNAGELDALEAEWLALEHLSPASAVFQSFSHIRIWARHFLGQKRGSRLHVAVVREHGRPVLILPLVISGLPHLRIARIAGDPIAQYSEMLARSGARIAPRRSRPRSLQSSQQASTRSSSVACATIRSCFGVASRTSAAAGGADRGALRRSLRASPISRRFLKSPFQEDAPGTAQSPQSPGEGRTSSSSRSCAAVREAREAIAEAIDLKRKWLVQRGSMSSAFVDPATRECLLDLAEQRRERRGRDAPDASTARRRRSASASNMAARISLYMSAYDARFADLSPGKLLMEFLHLGVQGARPRARSTCCRRRGTSQEATGAGDAMGVADYALPLTTRRPPLCRSLSGAAFAPALKRAFDAPADAAPLARRRRSSSTSRRPSDRVAQATPSFFCRLVDDVVYWNTMRSFGWTIRLAACAISAASWKPERMSFSLPG